MSDQAHPDRDLAPAFAWRLRALTPARVGLARTGVSLQTRDLLEFQRSHSQARDAVHSRLEAASLASALAQITAQQVLCLHSAAPDRATYLQRPDLGRTLNESSRALLAGHRARIEPNPQRLALVVADGLSALAVERHAAPLIEAALPVLHDWQIAPLSVVEQGRVAIGDEIGALLCAQISIVLIGERPGLSSPDSLGAYITWAPRPGRTDAERNCISNIRMEGLSYAHAAAQLGYYLTEARDRQLTGFSLKEQADTLEEKKQIV
jgi:ethanolamine ammonia-lyase small subunit